MAIIVWQRHLQERWGLKTELTRLDGEFDLNLSACTEDGQHYLVKVMRSGCDRRFVDMQCRALAHTRSCSQNLRIPQVVLSRSGLEVESIEDEQGEHRLVWVLTYIDGIVYADFLPKSLPLAQQLGQQFGRLHLALASFDHPYLLRDFKWNLVNADWISTELDVISNGGRRQLLEDVLAGFQHIRPLLSRLPNVAIHNDLNDYNLILAAALHPGLTTTGIIDFGDMCLAPRICDLAIAAAYLVLDHPTPEPLLAALVSGFHKQSPITEDELELLFPLLRMRLAVSVVNSSTEARRKPDDPYVVISQAPAWRFLESTDIDSGLLCCRLRVACGYAPTRSAQRVSAFIDSHRGSFASIMKVDRKQAVTGSLSVENSIYPRNPFSLTQDEALQIPRPVASTTDAWLGYYNEPRLVYTDSAFYTGPWRNSDRRTVHLGIDVFLPAGSPVYAPLDGEVVVAEYRAAALDYGGLVVLAHRTHDDDVFYTLYGHLDPESFIQLSRGTRVDAGQQFCSLGGVSVNGGWTPHLHLQLALTIDGLGTDWPGVADPDEIDFWNALCPNPAALLNMPAEKLRYRPIDEAALREQRQTHFGSNLKLSYHKPLTLLRGWRHHLFDPWGRPYLDAYNNVPHVGHAHPRIQAVVSQQLMRMNSNTRYLHPAQTAFAETLLTKMPPGLKVCYFVNSGSEANELALRLARAHTGAKDIITPDHGYHGNTTGAIDISAYKFNAPGGVGQPDWVQLVDIPDSYRSPLRESTGNDSTAIADLYARQVDEAIACIKYRRGRLAGFIAETFPSVGGQIVPPDGYLNRVYKSIRDAGGVCIADEVQTGLGRLGDYYFAFEQQKVTPDIVVLGKPIGNGHPIGVVITTQAIADSFASGPEYFSTFGGSTLSCIVGKEVLDIVEDERLQQNASQCGNILLEGFRNLMNKHPCIGDVRGMGLFIGVEFVTDRETQSPATRIAAHVVNRLRDYRILTGLEGPADNVLKIRPPLTIDVEDAGLLLNRVDEILAESAVG